jgi:lipoprotein-anchoring transpeptidase ErfK/SrfK
MNDPLDRRAVLAGLSLLLAGCAAPQQETPQLSLGGGAQPGDTSRYDTLDDNGNEIPPLDLASVDPDLLRQEVAYRGPYRPGTIVVKVPERRLYLIQPNGTALRYAVGVGRSEALDFHGSAVVGRKAVWPRWTPTVNMMEKLPGYSAYAGGMEGGIGNPLGARALYLYRGDRDTLFRLHGTNEPTTIGQPVSSGCIRLFNQDIIDLYSRVPVGAPVVVLQE